MNLDLNVMDTGEILRKILAGQKPFPDEAIHLCDEGDLLDLALAAREMARRQQPEDTVGYAVSKTVVYSNVCQPKCPFCTTTVTKDDAGAFTKSADEVVAEVAEAVAAGATEIVLQGGHRIDLEWAYYPGLVRAIKERFPGVYLYAYSPTEVMVFNVAYQKTTNDIIRELKAAGMDGFLAGGAPTMNNRAPEYRALLRGPWSEWIEVVHRCADNGIPVVAPFVFGLGEGAKDRVGLLYRTRAIQERTSKGGHGSQGVFKALAVFTLTPPAPTAPQPAPAEHVVTVEGEAVKVDPTASQAQPPVTGHEYLRMVALARLLAPVIPMVQSSFVAQGAKVAQVALDGGATDLGGTHMEYTKADLAAGRVGSMTAAEMERLIRETGRTPRQRTGL